MPKWVAMYCTGGLSFERWDFEVPRGSTHNRETLGGDADMEAPEWEYGVSCPYCYSLKSEEEKERARARQRQFEAWGIIGDPNKVGVQQ
ncbi:hypothetical protein CRYUN_Cryun41cG0075500 [Craigia yunnanensis]